MTLACLGVARRGNYQCFCEPNDNLPLGNLVSRWPDTGLQKISSGPTSSTSVSAVSMLQKSRADKVDAFLLDTPGGPQEAPAEAGGTKPLPPLSASEAATPADFPMASASRTSVTHMPQAGLKLDAQQPETSAITEMDIGPKRSSDTSFFSARSTTPAEQPDQPEQPKQPEQPERESFVRVGPLVFLGPSGENWNFPAVFRMKQRSSVSA